jgi:2-oxoglutarate dehydrogenase E1 component
MLRLPASCSSIESFVSGRFENVIGDEAQYENAERLLVCSGKIVHELRAEREKRGEKDVAIITLEQLYPFPEEDFAEVLDRFPNMKSITWVQEEPANMGALSYVRPFIEQFADIGTVSAVRRSVSASPATGSLKAHELEQKALIKLAFASPRR